MSYFKHLIGCICCITALQGFAQDLPAITRLQWNSSPVIHAVPKSLAAEPAVIINDKRRIEYIDFKDNQEQYKTLHKIVHINDDRGIEAFNKIYLPVTENKQIVDIRARTILPGGKTIELNHKDIKEVKEEDRIYKIFALEGLVKGCEVEFMYTYHANLSYFGREMLQGNFHVLNSVTEVISPERLVFETKLFNSTASKSDTTIGGKKIVIIEQANIKASEEEKYAMHTANLSRIEYKLSYNKAKSETERIFTWSSLAKNVFSANGEFSEKEMKKMNALVTSQGWKKLADNTQKIIEVENYFKKHIATREDVISEDAENIEWIIKNKICTHRGMMRLFSAALNILGVSHEYVLTGSRRNFTLDKDFENWSNCENYLLYFPESAKYLAPTVAEVRYPWIEPEWAGTNGIFCKRTTIGNYTSAIGYVKKITLEDAAKSVSNIEAKVNLNAAFDALVIDHKQVYSGYFCSGIRSAFNNNSNEDQERILKMVIKQSLGTEKIIATSLENVEFENYAFNKPFVLNAKVEAPALVEKAGNKILIKFGEIIGPQVQLYLDKERQFPIEIPFGHVMERKISLEVPAGYRVKNLNDLNINQDYQDNNELTMNFTSTYKMNGAMLEVHVLEQYLKTYYPIEQYDPFKKIVNAAADFNKVVLVLEKI